MSDDPIKRALDKSLRELAGDGPIEKQILLLKLTDLIENPPMLAEVQSIPGNSEHRKWLAKAGALLKRFDKYQHGVKFDLAMTHLGNYQHWAVNTIIGLVWDAIEAIQLDLELDGRDQIGNAYAAGEYYDYFRDLKEIIGRATNQLVIVDPYFDGKAFQAYLSEVSNQVEIRILADRYSTDVKQYAERHAQQHGTRIELRRSKELHDRLIFVDREDCWITGGSVKDAGKRPAYLIPAQPVIGQKKLEIYQDVWRHAQPLP